MPNGVILYNIRQEKFTFENPMLGKIFDAKNDKSESIGDYMVKEEKLSE